MKHLTEAIEHGKAGHADIATEHAETALTHLTEVHYGINANRGGGFV